MFENFKAFLVEELGRIDPDSITMESSLSGDLGINSLELADMIYNCESNYNVTIDDDSLKNFKTVGDVVRFLESATK
ncbi:MAG: acyl carrier protein [Clostridia bacterium]|nr:acyl carrier protein [Clostridia bacterium]